MIEESVVAEISIEYISLIWAAMSTSYVRRSARKAHTHAVEGDGFLFQLLGNHYLALRHDLRFKTTRPVPGSRQRKFTGCTLDGFIGFAITAVALLALLLVQVSRQLAFQGRF